MKIEKKPFDLTAPTTNCISLDDAVKRTENWRKFISNPSAAAVMHAIPKAVYISKSDIVAMYKSLEENSEFTGARAYFTLKYDPKVETEKNIVTFCMVMVRECSYSRCGEDVLPLLRNEVGTGDDDDTGIYDYTRPCPDFCDPKSVLFGD
ncbi:hypothetical protein [Mucilaginibacter terrae]|uniref:Uncharacterized protein n=1 Tax=Mucilaginibacter terrae TaxID=1955052 RepID=A0ABU3GY08_9SPHI|nr:hypothetical protein [Mucilaginibacter terrae]MDT3403882.1 hypothetical protein [Mucilaginibacter terrae]